MNTQTSLDIVHGDEGAKAIVLAGPFTEYTARGTLKGVAAADDAECFTFKDEGGYTSTLVFPKGTTVRPKGTMVFRRTAVVLPGGITLQQGAEATLTGSLMPANEGASACLNYARLFLVDTGGPPA